MNNDDTKTPPNDTPNVTPFSAEASEGKSAISPEVIGQARVLNDAMIENRIQLVCDCRCRSFTMLASGAVLCVACDKVVDPTKPMKWTERVVTPQGNDQEDNYLRQSNMSLNPGSPNYAASEKTVGAAKMARFRVMKEFNKLSDTGNLKMVVGFGADGAGHLWVDAENDAEKEWLKSCVARTMKFLKEMKTDSAFVVRFHVGPEGTGEAGSAEEGLSDPNAIDGAL